MNAKRWLSVFGSAAILLYATGVSADNDGRPFDNGSIRGSYGFSFSGSILASPPVLVAAVGRFVADGNGNITDGWRTISIDGTPVVQTFTCTYLVQPEGTGTASCPVEGGGTETFSVVLNTQAKELDFVATNPGTIVVGTARKQ